MPCRHVTLEPFRENAQLIQVLRGWRAAASAIPRPSPSLAALTP